MIVRRRGGKVVRSFRIGVVETETSDLTTFNHTRLPDLHDIRKTLV